MKIRLKMLGDLRQYLPIAGTFNECELTLSAQGRVSDVLALVKLPADKEALLMVNDEMVRQSELHQYQLKSGDVLTLFPPIKGG